MASSLTAPMAMPRGAVIRLADSPATLAQAAASEVLAVLEAAIAWRGEAHLGLAGGRTPTALYQALAALPFEGWSRVHVWFGDERAVPPEHAESNYRMANEVWLAAAPIPPSQVHRWESELAPAAAAGRYHDALLALAARQERPVPALDLLLLGMGADAHTASLFPGSPLLDESQADRDAHGATAPRLAAAVHVPALDTWRLTLTPTTIQAARTVVVLVAGEDKHPALRRVLGQATAAIDAPAVLLHHLPGDVAWFVDRAALFGAA